MVSSWRHLKTGNTGYQGLLPFYKTEAPTAPARGVSWVSTNVLALVEEPRGSVGHYTGPLGGGDRLAKVRLPGLDVGAVGIFRHIQRDHMIAGLH